MDKRNFLQKLSLFSVISLMAKIFFKKPTDELQSEGKKLGLYVDGKFVSEVKSITLRV